MNFCSPQAYLVNAQGVIPADASDYNHKNLPTLGCSHLTCRRCQREVRSVPQRMATRELSAAELAELHALPAPRFSPLLSPHETGRLYFCACEMWLERETHGLNETDPRPSDPLMSWSCQGHPLVTLPHSFEGVQVTDEGGLAALFTSALGDVLPPGAALDGTYAARLFLRLNNSPLQSCLAPLATSLLEADGIQIRKNVLQFYVRTADAQARDRVLQTFRKRPDLYGLQPCHAQGLYACSTLVDLVWLVLRSHTEAMAEVLDLARRYAVQPHQARIQLYLLLEEFDPSWLIQHAEEIVLASPAHADDLLQRMVWLGKARGQDLRPLAARVRARLATAKP